MIVLDTNVLSELMLPNPEPSVLDWLRNQPIKSLATTTINIAELKHGMARLPAGRCRGELERKFAGLAARGLTSSIFDFDLPAANIFGDILAARERAGRRLEGFDGMIAAIALSRAHAVATRNTADFDGCGLEVINPWEAIVAL